MISLTQRWDIAALLKCQCSLKACRPRDRLFTPIPYPSNPLTISDFLRKRRIDLGLRQRDVASILHVNVGSIRNWESNTCEPIISKLSTIIEFIRYCPYDVRLPTHKKVVLWRSYNGLTQKEMARLVGIDPTTLARLENGRIRMSSHSALYIDRLRAALRARQNNLD